MFFVEHEYLFRGGLYITNPDGVVIRAIGLGSWVRCYDEPKFFRALPNFPGLTNFLITDSFRGEAKFLRTVEFSIKDDE